MFEANAANYKMMMTACVRVVDPSLLLGAIRLKGPEAKSFLQGMCTNDIEALKPNEGCYVAFLTPKGAMVGDGHVILTEDGLYIATGANFRDVILKYLNQFLISEDAEIEAADEVIVTRFIGPEAQRVVSETSETFASVPGFLKTEILAFSKSEILKNIAAIDAATFHVRRVEEGVPLFGIDMKETTIPLEANLERAINYKKGCYIGQEVIARATFRGQVNKKLVQFECGENSCETGTDIFSEDKKIGFVTSVVKSIELNQVLALGYAHRDSCTNGTKVLIGERQMSVRVLTAAG